jgi:hypothetical protein
MGDRAAGALAFRDGIAYEANPHVPGGPAVAQFCRLEEWPEAAREWHRGWSGEARRQADAAGVVSKEVARG